MYTELCHIVPSRKCMVPNQYSTKLSFTASISHQESQNCTVQLHVTVTPVKLEKYTRSSKLSPSPRGLGNLNCSCNCCCCCCSCFQSDSHCCACGSRHTSRFAFWGCCLLAAAAACHCCPAAYGACLYIMLLGRAVLQANSTSRQDSTLHSTDAGRANATL